MPVPVTVPRSLAALLVEWLATQGVTYRLTRNIQPASPAEVVTIGDAGGYGLTVEMSIRNPTVQVRCRADTDLAAARMAWEMDQMILFSPLPFEMAGVRVIDTAPVGGDPSFLSRDENGWTTYVANYRMMMERG